MSNKLYYIFGGLLVIGVVVALGISYPLASDSSDGLAGPQGEQGEIGSKGSTGSRGPRGFQGTQGDQGSQGLGALSNPELFLPFLSVNGVNRFYHDNRFAQGTTTVCSFLSPPATSTLVVAKMQATEATSTDLYFNVGRGADGQSSDFATTTLYDTSATTTPTVVWSVTSDDTSSDDFNPSIVASTSVDFAKVGSSQETPNDLNLIFLPNTRLNFAIEAATLDASLDKGLNLDGTCSAVFEQF